MLIAVLIFTHVLALFVGGFLGAALVMAEELNSDKEQREKTNV